MAREISSAQRIPPTIPPTAPLDRSDRLDCADRGTLALVVATTEGCGLEIIIVEEVSGLGLENWTEVAVSVMSVVVPTSAFCDVLGVEEVPPGVVIMTLR